MNIQQLVILAAALTVVSCRVPKASAPEKPPIPKQESPKPPALALPTGGIVPLPNDGIRMGDMLDLPTEGDFRSIVPKQSPGPVVARPPTEPPSRVKPTPPQPE